MIELARFKRDKETKEEKIVPLSLYKKDIICLYRDRNGVFIVLNQGYMYKVPYKLEELSEYLDF